MKSNSLFVIPLLVLGCVPRPYSDFQRAIDGASEEDLIALDGAGKEGGLLLIALLETELTWRLQPQEPPADAPKGLNVGDPEPLLIVESVGNHFPGVIPGFERFTAQAGYKPPTKVHVVLRNPWALLWAMDRDKERTQGK